MIRIRHLTLPPGLSAMLRQTPDGDLEIFVSDALDPGRQRAAVRVALRSSRQAGRRVALLPIPLVLLLAGIRSGLRAASRAIRLHAVTSAAIAGLVVMSAAGLIVALPHHHAPSSASGLPSVGRVHALAPRPSTSTSPKNSRSPHPARTPKALPHPQRTAVPASVSSATAPSVQKSATAAPSASPAPTSSGTTSSSPTTAPTPSQSPPAGGQPCLVLLGITVCL